MAYDSLAALADIHTGGLPAEVKAKIKRLTFILGWSHNDAENQVASRIVSLEGLPEPGEPLLVHLAGKSRGGSESVDEQEGSYFLEPSGKISDELVTDALLRTEPESRGDEFVRLYSSRYHRLLQIAVATAELELSALPVIEGSVSPDGLPAGQPGQPAAAPPA